MDSRCEIGLLTTRFSSVVHEQDEAIMNAQVGISDRDRVARNACVSRPRGHPGCPLPSHASASDGDVTTSIGVKQQVSPLMLPSLQLANVR